MSSFIITFSISESSNIPRNELPKKKLSMSKLIMHYQSKTYLAFLFLIDFCDFGFDFELILILLLLFLLPFLDFKYVFRFLDN